MNHVGLVHARHKRRKVKAIGGSYILTSCESVDHDVIIEVKVESNVDLVLVSKEHGKGSKAMIAIQTEDLEGR